MILLMAGTSEGRELASFLAHQGYALLVTTVSEYAGSLLEKGIEHLARPLGSEELKELIVERQVKILIDATHPYAVEASKNAQNAATQAGIEYCRWERTGTYLNECNQTVIQVSNSFEAVQKLETFERILLTIGSKKLANYATLIHNPDKKVYVRVLPLPASLQTCWEMGIPSGQIIACQGPFSYEWNIAMIKQYQIEAMLTKDSGQRGGVEDKIKAASACNIPIVLIKKPQLSYLQQAGTLDELENKLHILGLCKERRF